MAIVVVVAAVMPMESVRRRDGALSLSIFSSLLLVRFRQQSWTTLVGAKKRGGTWNVRYLFAGSAGKLLRFAQE